MTTSQEVLQDCTVEGNIIKLPSVQLERKLYLEVAKALELIGGKWKGGKVYGFVFQENPEELLKQLKAGEKRNIKKEFQFFPTPPDLAREMVILSYLEKCNTFSRILEPSAGQGAIVKEIFIEQPNRRQVDCCEIMPLNRTFLEKIDGVQIIADDFLSLGPEYNNYYDRVIANPPFANNQDIDHIRKMFEVCKPGGRVISLSSPHWTFAEGKKERAFRDWLYSLQAYYFKYEAGAFKKSGTNIETMLIEINKPE